MTARSRDGAAPVSDNRSTVIDGLLDALASERRLLEELGAIMRRQREALAADNLEAVDDTVYAAHRVLRTVNEARRRRHALARTLGTSADLEIESAGTEPDGPLAAPLLAARQALRETARALSREVEINRRLLRQALTEGNDQRAISGRPEPKLLCAGNPTES